MNARAKTLRRRLRRDTAAICLAVAAIGGVASAQTTNCNGAPITLLDFRSPTLVSGSALTAGAIYRFSNVAAGVDAVVRIDAVTNGTLTILDRDTGLVPAFQPELGGSNERSADFTISFVTAGGSTPVSVDFAASGIDIDGDSASLREYAEFSTPFDAFAVESPTNLDVNASGPSVPGNFRFESRTAFTAPGIDPTSTPNIVSVLYKATTSFRYRIGALGTGSTNRLTSLDFSCPVLNFPATTTPADQDYGDAPGSYGNPAHAIVAGMRLGAANNADTGPYDSPSAVGDDGDDGVALPQLNLNFTATVAATVAGAGGFLQGWFDWNGDGDFADAGEQAATNLQDNGVDDLDPATGAIAFNVTPPASATTLPTFARFRWSTQSGLSAGILAPDGEVEDYAVTISAGPPPPSCPAGQLLLNSTGNAVAVTAGAGVINAARALGPPSAAGAAPPDPSSAEIDDAADTLVLDLGVRVPQNSTILLSAARDGGNQGNTARVNIQFSTDNVTYSTAVTYGAAPATYVSAVRDVLEHNNIVVPAGGARYIRLRTVDNDDVFIDGVQYSQICLASPTLTVSKTVAVYNPAGVTPFAVPGNDVVYALTVQNAGSGPVDSDTLFIVDTLPAEVTFFNGDMDGAGPATGPVLFTQTGAGLTYSPATDLKYSSAAARPANFSACAYTPAAGYDPNVKHVCLNPKGAMAAGPGSSFTAQFRARIN